MSMFGNSRACTGRACSGTAERPVALLAAAGRSNQEIAGELFLSRRTLESHVAGMLRRLGSRSRNQLGAVSQRPG